LKQLIQIEEKIKDEWENKYIQVIYNLHLDIFSDSEEE
jgi:hypothetical protein